MKVLIISLFKVVASETAYKLFADQLVSREGAIRKCEQFENGSLARVISEKATQSIDKQMAGKKSSQYWVQAIGAW